MRSDRFRFFVFTCRDPNTDFRLPLVDALRRRFETYYVWLRRQPVVSGPGTADAPVEMSIPGFLRFARRFRRDDAVNVYFNSTNTYFPGMSMLLRRVMTGGVWCFDMHDDLRYHNTGMKRWREGAIASLLYRMSDVTVHAAPTLKALFPGSVHLGNASNVLPLSRGATEADAVLIIASFDERFDFTFVESLATLRSDIRFDLHGWTRPDDQATMARLVALAASHPNVRYHGAYKMADLPGILARYRISVAPYLAGSELTRYIDPLRFYHCLNAGLEVISTDIPQARFMGEWIHVVADAAACAETLTAVRAGRLAKQGGYRPITWEQRADRLVEILRALPRAGVLRGETSADC